MATVAKLTLKDPLVDIVREVLARRSIDRPIRDDEDLREVGLNSLDLVNLMLAVESELDLKIPESEMTLKNFRSIAAIRVLVDSLLQHN
jgi:acyl carrier protein